MELAEKALHGRLYRFLLSLEHGLVSKVAELLGA
jgi:hypothetical protein